MQMSQSAWIAVAILTGFLIFLAIRGKLAIYWTLLTGGAVSSSASSPASSPIGAAAGAATGGGVGQAIGAAIGAAGSAAPASSASSAPSPASSPPVMTFDGVTLPADLFGMVPP